MVRSWEQFGLAFPLTCVTGETCRGTAVAKKPGSGDDISHAQRSARSTQEYHAETPGRWAMVLRGG